MNHSHTHTCDCGHHHEDDSEYMHQPNKYDATLAKYAPAPGDDEVSRAVSTLLAERAAANDTPEVHQQLLSCLDLTSLAGTDNDESILRLVERVNAFEEQHPDLKNVAAICVYPTFASLVSQSLEVEDTAVACVAGGFPSSQTFTEVKVAETAMALHEGATEIDIVLPVGRYLSGDYESLCDEIEELKAVCGDRTLKVILETSLLGTSDHIKRAAILAMYSGADFIKTSTGKDGSVATPEAAYVMCQAIKEYHRQTQRVVGFKAAGGIHTVEQAVAYYTIVKEVLGEEWLTPSRFRIGASRLAEELLK